MTFRLALLVGVFLVVLPRLPGAWFGGSVAVAVVVALPFAVLGRLGHSKVERIPGKSGLSMSPRMRALVGHRWGWFAVVGIWLVAFLVLPSVVLRLVALVPSANLEFRGWWSTLLPATTFLVVHTLAVSLPLLPRRVVA
jgi:hypothetical protein